MKNGRTTELMLTAKQKTIFIWCNSHLDYPKQLAKFLDRTDLEIVRPEWLTSQKWRGRYFSDIVLDHAALRSLTSKQWDCYREVMLRVKENL